VERARNGIGRLFPDPDMNQFSLLSLKENFFEGITVWTTCLSVCDLHFGAGLAGYFANVVILDNTVIYKAQVSYFKRYFGFLDNRIR